MVTLKDALQKKGGFSEKQIELLPRSFDVIGDIIILGIPPILEKKKKQIGEALLSLHRHIKVVCARSGIHEGTFRTQKLKVIAGEKRKETEHKENGVMTALNVEKVYFSPRLGTERMRIASQVKPGELVLVMFSGCGIYPLVIARNSKAKEVYGIELNKAAHKYALENIKLNRLDNVHCINGDVRKIKINKKFDRIAMPLPKQAEYFLDIALGYAKKHAVIHFYDFEHEDEFYKAEKKIADALTNAKRKFKAMDLVKCGQYSPRKYRICVDVMLQ